MTFFVVGGGSPLAGGAANHCPCRRPGGSIPAGQLAGVSRYTSHKIAVCNLCLHEQALARKKAAEEAAQGPDEAVQDPEEGGRAGSIRDSGS